MLLRAEADFGTVPDIGRVRYARFELQVLREDGDGLFYAGMVVPRALMNVRTLLESFRLD